VPVPAAFDSADYELLWPCDLFARELAALRTGLDSKKQQHRVLTRGGVSR
jgi:hypothetical protein